MNEKPFLLVDKIVGCMIHSSSIKRDESGEIGMEFEFEFSSDEKMSLRASMSDFL